MGALLADNRLSEANYLAGEKVSEIKHEYIDGVVRAMSGGSAGHSAVATNFVGFTTGKLAGSPCRPFNSDLAIRYSTDDKRRYYYPDASVVCGSVDLSESFVHNPVIILEVLSPSTRANDETAKKADYLALPSTKVLILAESETVFCNVYRKSAEGVFYEGYSKLSDTIQLPEVGIKLTLAELYDGLDLDGEEGEGLPESLTE